MKRVTIALGALAVLCIGVFAAAKEAAAYSQRGVASYYCCYFHGRTTANGERFNQNAMTAAHKYLPFGSVVRVTNVKTGRSIVVRINDRGPFVGGRIIDLSRGAARALGMGGLAQVRIDVIGGGKRTLIAKNKRSKSRVQVASAKKKAQVRVASARAKAKRLARIASYEKRKKAVRIASYSKSKKKSLRVASYKKAKFGKVRTAKLNKRKAGKATQVAASKKRIAKYGVGFVKKKKPVYKSLLDQ